MHNQAATSEEPKYLIFWSAPEKAGELAQRIGMKGNGKDPSAVGKLMEGAQPLANDGKLFELEKLVDQALEMLGETGKSPDIYGRE